eukprot:SAG31_NODE_2565_length_5468_cov_8.226672_4_plen_410_part_00
MHRGPNFSQLLPITPNHSQSLPITPNHSQSLPINRNYSQSLPINPNQSQSTPINPNGAAALCIAARRGEVEQLKRLNARSGGRGAHPVHEVLVVGAGAVLAALLQADARGSGGGQRARAAACGGARRRTSSNCRSIFTCATTDTNRQEKKLRRGASQRLGAGSAAARRRRRRRSGGGGGGGARCGAPEAWGGGGLARTSLQRRHARIFLDCSVALSRLAFLLFIHVRFSAFEKIEQSGTVLTTSMRGTTLCCSASVWRDRLRELPPPPPCASRAAKDAKDLTQGGGAGGRERSLAPSCCASSSASSPSHRRRLRPASPARPPARPPAHPLRAPGTRTGRVQRRRRCPPQSARPIQRGLAKRKGKGQRKLKKGNNERGAQRILNLILNFKIHLIRWMLWLCTYRRERGTS